MRREIEYKIRNQVLVVQWDYNFCLAKSGLARQRFLVIALLLLPYVLYRSHLTPDEVSIQLRPDLIRSLQEGNAT